MDPEALSAAATAATPTNLNAILSSVLFGGIGSALLIYGRKQGDGKFMIIGGLLLAESYFVKSTLMLWAVGSVLLLALKFL